MLICKYCCAFGCSCGRGFLFESCCTRAHHPQLHLSKEPRLKLSPHPLHIEVQPYMHGPNSPALDDHPDHRQMQQACISLRRFDDSLAEMPYLQTCHRAVSFMACLQPFMLHAHPGGGGGLSHSPQGKTTTVLHRLRRVRVVHRSCGVDAGGDGHPWHGSSAVVISFCCISRRSTSPNTNIRS